MARPTRAYIPPNLVAGGSMLGGLLKTRHVIEAGVWVGLDIALFVFLGKFLPTMLCLVAGIASAVLLFIINLMGIGGEPLSIFLLNIVNYRRTSTFVTLRMPMPYEPEPEPKKKKGKKQEEQNFDIGQGGVEKLLERLMYGKEK